MTSSAVIAGFASGLGHELAVKFVEQELRVGLIARTADKLENAASALGSGVISLPVDLSDPDAVEAAIDHLEKTAGPIELAVFNAGTFMMGSVLELRPADFEHAWRAGAYGGFVFGQAVAKRMVARKAGTIIFSGATASIRGNAGSSAFSSPKFALRSVAQSMARELSPLGVHVAHVILDGQIRGDFHEDRGGDSQMEPQALSEIYLQLHKQPRSTWTHELDVRPWTEKF